MRIEAISEEVEVVAWAIADPVVTVLISRNLNGFGCFEIIQGKTLLKSQGDARHCRLFKERGIIEFDATTYQDCYLNIGDYFNKTGKPYTQVTLRAFGPEWQAWCSIKQSWIGAGSNFPGNPPPKAWAFWSS